MTKYLWDKESPWMPLSSFCVGHLLLVMRPALKSGVCPQWDLLERTNFSFISGYQVETTSGLGLCPLLLVLRDLSGSSPLAQTCAGPVHADTSLWVHMCVGSAVSRRSCFPSISHDLPPLLLQGSLSPRAGGIWWRYPFRAECSKAFHSLHVVQLWVSICSHLLLEVASLMMAEQGNSRV